VNAQIIVDRHGVRRIACEPGDRGGPFSASARLQGPAGRPRLQLDRPRRLRLDEQHRHDRARQSRRHVLGVSRRDFDANKLDPKGFLGGGQAGFNWQFSPLLVAGLEADISWTDLNKTVVSPGTQDATRIIMVQENADWLGTVRGRLGVTPTDRVLAYVTGGLGIGHGSLSTALTRTTGCAGNNCQQGSVTATNLGWTAGTGVEWAFASNWSAKLEYLHYDLDTMSHLMTDPRPGNTAVWISAAELKGDIIRGGVNFRFSGP
jgi:opacity protein-like surface antigen